jgi:hypothetical protein
MKKILLTALLTATFSVSAGDFLPSSHNWNNGSVDQVKKIVAEAYALNKQAASVGFEWRDTVKFIQKAEKLGAEGKRAQALKAAEFAKYQAILSIRQSVDQANAGPNF